jgi:hypothetical protein
VGGETRQYGHLAERWCKLKLPLQVLTSEEGYYIGTFNEDGPISRESEEFYPTREAADAALAGGRWTQRHLS